MENIYMYAENWSKRDGKLRTPRGCKNPVNKRPGRLIDRLVYLKFVLFPLRYLFILNKYY